MSDNAGWVYLGVFIGFAAVEIGFVIGFTWWANRRGKQK